MWSRSQTSASGHVETVFPRLGLFIWQFLHLVTKCWTSWVMPGNHAIILIDAFFPGCVSRAFAKSKCRSLGGMKGTTPLKMIPLCKLSASFCCSYPFSTSEHCFQLPLFDSFHYVLEESIFFASSVLISAWVTKSLWAKKMLLIAKHTQSLSDSSSSIHSAQSIRMGYQLSRNPSCDSRWCCLRDLLVWCKEMF